MTTERKESCPECATPSPKTYGEVTLPVFGRYAKGGGYELYDCPSCGHSWAVTFDLTLHPPGTFKNLSPTNGPPEG